MLKRVSHVVSITVAFSRDEGKAGGSADKLLEDGARLRRHARRRG
jgi:hypothetical protein